MDAKSIKLLDTGSLDSRIREAPLCCVLRAKRGLAFWRGSPVSPPRKGGEVRNGSELSQFQMKLCMGEIFWRLKLVFQIS